MNDYEVLFEAVLAERHRVTGRTVHRVGSDVLPKPSKLRIAKYPDAEGVYLLHFDASDEEMTDTFHDSVDDAMAQAEWEFGILPSEWDERRTGASDRNLGGGPVAGS